MRRRFSAAAIRDDRDARVIGGVGERLPFADESFDSVVTTLTLCMVEDLEAVISEIRRVLVPGGDVPVLRTRSVRKRPRSQIADARQPPMEVRHHRLQPRPRHRRRHPRRRIQRRKLPTLHPKRPQNRTLPQHSRQRHAIARQRHILL